jgi:hypothetical protein
MKNKGSWTIGEFTEMFSILEEAEKQNKVQQNGKLNWSQYLESTSYLKAKSREQIYKLAYNLKKNYNFKPDLILKHLLSLPMSSSNDTIPLSSLISAGMGLPLGSILQKNIRKNQHTSNLTNNSSRFVKNSITGAKKAKKRRDLIRKAANVGGRTKQRVVFRDFDKHIVKEMMVSTVRSNMLVLEHYRQREMDMDGNMIHDENTIPLTPSEETVTSIDSNNYTNNISKKSSDTTRNFSHSKRSNNSKQQNQNPRKSKLTKKSDKVEDFSKENDGEEEMSDESSMSEEERKLKNLSKYSCTATSLIRMKKKEKQKKPKQTKTISKFSDFGKTVTDFTGTGPSMINELREQARKSKPQIQSSKSEMTASERMQNFLALKRAKKAKEAKALKNKHHKYNFGNNETGSESSGSSIENMLDCYLSEGKASDEDSEKEEQANLKQSKLFKEKMQTNLEKSKTEEIKLAHEANVSSDEENEAMQEIEKAFESQPGNLGVTLSKTEKEMYNFIKNAEYEKKPQTKKCKKKGKQNKSRKGKRSAREFENQLFNVIKITKADLDKALLIRLGEKNLIQKMSDDERDIENENESLNLEKEKNTNKCEIIKKRLLVEVKCEMESEREKSSTAEGIEDDEENTNDKEKSNEESNDNENQQTEENEGVHSTPLRNIIVKTETLSPVPEHLPSSLQLSLQNPLSTEQLIHKLAHQFNQTHQQVSYDFIKHLQSAMTQYLTNIYTLQK